MEQVAFELHGKLGKKKIRLIQVVEWKLIPWKAK